jgi:hypothetical protein
VRPSSPLGVLVAPGSSNLRLALVLKILRERLGKIQSSGMAQAPFFNRIRHSYFRLQASDLSR